ncbi:MAG: hypothetical protein ABJE95_37325 [Byssovorax sp.]
MTFDRLLLPTATFRQSACLTSGVNPVKSLKGCANGVFLEPAYDPVRREIIYRQQATSTGLIPGTPYTFSVFPPPGDGSTNGIQAFDGAPLGEARSLTFTTRTPEPAGGLVDKPPTVDFCGDLFPHVLRDTCASGGCHTVAAKEDHGVILGAAEGLDFSTPAKILTTAVSHVAHETQTGEHATMAEDSPSLLGRAMPLIDPSRPGNSYVLYKLIANQNNGAKGGSPTLEQKRLADIEELRSVVVVGIPMPPSDGRGKELKETELEQISDWIAQGAPTVCP